MELTILMPCLNEERTIAACINEAKAYLEPQSFSWEILVVDNGSTDTSAPIARGCGARVIHCKESGYGSALRKGIMEAKGRYIIYGDCDMSYDFRESDRIYRELAAGIQLVAGNRFHPFPSSEAMSLSHRLGVPVLSMIGRLRYGVKVHDFHCGLRGINTSCARELGLKAHGMEFATEIIAKASRAGLTICEVPITLRADGRGGPPHLRTIKDGFRHLHFMLSPLK